MTLEGGQRPVPVSPDLRPNTARFVDLGNGRMGSQADRFSLASMFDLELDDNPSESQRPTQVYFRTESGNIYFLDLHGRLINKKLSLELGRVHVWPLDPYLLSRAGDLIKGSRFLLGGRTTIITEIVATSPEMELRSEITRGKTSSLVEDFLRDLPPIPEVGASV